MSYPDVEDHDDWDDWSNYESGPFCPHWGDEGCEVVCTCGHLCRHHCIDEGDCTRGGCDCADFTDPPPPPKPPPEEDPVLRCSECGQYHPDKSSWACHVDAMTVLTRQYVPSPSPPGPGTAFFGPLREPTKEDE